MRTMTRPGSEAASDNSWRVTRCFLVILASGAAAACAVNAENSSVMPGVDLGHYRNFYVVEEKGEHRDVNKLITAWLRDKGLDASTGPADAEPDSTELRVEYQTVWHWDLRTFLGSLSIQFRDSRTGVIAATGTSEHYKMVHPTRKTMVDEVLTNIFTGNEVEYRNDYRRDLGADLMTVPSEGSPREPISGSVHVIGEGSQMASDQQFDDALSDSVKESHLFQSVVDNGDADRTLVVTLLSLQDVSTTYLVVTEIRDITVRSSWVLRNNSSGKVELNSEIETGCPQADTAEIHNIVELAGCSVRATIAAGLEQLAGLVPGQETKK